MIQSQGFPGGSDGKASARNAEGPGSIPGSGRSPGEGNGNPLQYSCLENSMDGGAWWATVHGVAKSRTRLSDFTKLLKWGPPVRQKLPVNDCLTGRLVVNLTHDFIPTRHTFTQSPHITILWLQDDAYVPPLSRTTPAAPQCQQPQGGPCSWLSHHFLVGFYTITANALHTV